MYFRTKITPTGKTLQLVESFRDPEGRPRQRIRLSLGDSLLPEPLHKDVLRGVEAKLSGHEDLLAQHASPEVCAWVDAIIRKLDVRLVPEPKLPPEKSANTSEFVHATVESEVSDRTPVPGSVPTIINGVIAERVTHQDSTILGPILVALGAWRTLGLPVILADLGFNSAQVKAATIEVINRLVDPVSEHALPAWLKTTSLPELLGTDFLPTDHHAFYRACDQIQRHQKAILAKVRDQERQHFQLQRTILLYDLTNTYFEGELLGNPQAKRGHSKEKRSDSPLVVVGMVFDEYGFELGHEVFAGNTSDSKSLIDMAVHMQAAVASSSTTCLSEGRPLVIVDGGIASAANRKLFQEKGFDYLANDSRPGRIKYAAFFNDDAQFTTMPGREGTAVVQVRSMPDPLAAEGTEPDTLILCKSAGRKLKESAIRSHAENRFLSDIGRLRTTIAKGRRTQRAVIEADLARIVARHPRVSRFYQTAAVLSDDKKFSISCIRKDAVSDQAEELLGCYVLRTCSKRLTQATDWWNLYMTLTQAENGFRLLKSDLGLRPIRHQLEHRAKSHILISVLAYHLLQFISFTLAKSGDHRSWETLRRILGTHCYTTVILPTIDGTTHRTRSAGMPDQTQQQIYAALGIDWRNLPKFQTSA